MSPRLPVWVAALLTCGLFSPDAFADPPRFVGRARITNPSFTGTRNTMMYDVQVTVDGTGADADHLARVGFVPTSDYTTCSDASVEWKWASSQTFDTTAVRTWSLYNFVPGTAYTYKIEVGDPSGTTRVRCGNLRTAATPTPELPTYLGRLNLQYAKSGAAYDTKYVVFETDDCGRGEPGGASYYIVAVDVDAETIVWYLDVGAMTGLGGVGSAFHYHQGATPQDDSVLLNVSKTHMYEWAFDGTEVHSRDFAPSGECAGNSDSAGPCVHHDVFSSNDSGNTYMLATRAAPADAMGTAWESKCGTGSRFLDDGFRVVDENWDLLADYSLMTDYGYDPTIDGGPDATAVAARRDSCNNSNWQNTFDPAYGMMDWLHENSIAASSFGGSEVIDLSMREWDQILRFDASTGDLLWSLSPHAGYTDWPVRKESTVAGRVGWQGQHGVHAIDDDTLMLLDNSGGGPAGSRVLEVELRSAPVSATITKSWILVDAAGDPLTCNIEGAAQQVPGSTDHVLATCAPEYSIIELDDPTGNSGTPPPLLVGLPDGRGTEPICTTGGPTNVHDIHGWHKGFAATRIGEF